MKHVSRVSKQMPAKAQQQLWGHKGLGANELGDFVIIIAQAIDNAAGDWVSLPSYLSKSEGPEF